MLFVVSDDKSQSGWFFVSDDEGQGVCCFLWQIINARVSVVCVSVMMVRVGVVSCVR